MEVEQQQQPTLGPSQLKLKAFASRFRLPQLGAAAKAYAQRRCHDAVGGPILTLQLHTILYGSPKCLVASLKG